MKNILLLSLAALVAAPAVVHADNDVSVDRFRVISVAGAQQDRSWTGGFESQAYTPRDIFCADEDHYTNNGIEYNVWVTRTSSADFSHTRLGNAGAAQYQSAAFLASFYITGSNSDNSTAAIPTLGSLDALSLQSAIWRTLGYDGDTHVSATQYAEGTAILNWLGGTTIPGAFDFTKWYVVSPMGPGRCAPKNSGPADRANGAPCDYQEMLVFDPDRPQETVPEPATMSLLATGLVGLAATRRRRRQK